LGRFMAAAAPTNSQRTPKLLTASGRTIINNKE